MINLGVLRRFHMKFLPMCLRKLFPKSLRICLSSSITAAPWISAIHLLQGGVANAPRPETPQFSTQEVCYSSAIATCDRQGQLERLGVETKKRPSVLEKSMCQAGSRCLNRLLGPAYDSYAAIQAHPPLRRPFRQWPSAATGA